MVLPSRSGPDVEMTHEQKFALLSLQGEMIERKYIYHTAVGWINTYKDIWSNPRTYIIQTFMFFSVQWQENLLSEWISTFSIYVLDTAWK